MGKVDAVYKDKGGYPRPLAKMMFCQITAGVKHMHSHKLVHCDLKPDNIFISEGNGCATLANRSE